MAAPPHQSSLALDTFLAVAASVALRCDAVAVRGEELVARVKFDAGLWEGGSFDCQFHNSKVLMICDNRQYFKIIFNLFNRLFAFTSSLAIYNDLL